MNRLLAVAALGVFIACSGSNDGPLAPSSTAPNEAGIAGTGTGTGNGTGGATGSAVYTGHAIAVDATMQENNTKLCDTGMLPKDGGRIERKVGTSSVSGALSASSLYCITMSMDRKGISEATVWGLNLTVGGNTIVVDKVHSMAGAFCPPNTRVPTSTGSAFVTNLRINGRLVTVKANTANQKFDLPNGSVMFNEHSTFASPWHAGRTVTGLRIVLTNGTVVVLARSQTHIDCP